MIDEILKRSVVPLILAPMDGYSNIPFRLIIKSMGPDLMFTEFVNSDAVIHSNKKTEQKIRILDKERPVAIQLFGRKPENMALAAKMIEDLGPEIIDLNFGCPAPKVSGGGSGAGLLRDLPLLSEICERVVNAVNIPVTAKMRLGWNSDSVNVLQTSTIFEESGIKMITLHPRTKVQKYKGSSDWSYIKMVKDNVNIPVIGNGDINVPEDVLRMKNETGCNGVMIGRAAVKDPWIFRQARELTETGKYKAATDFDERKKVCLDHFDLSVKFLGKRKGVLEMRKLYKNYFRQTANFKKFKDIVFKTLDPLKVRNAIDNIEEIISC